MALLDALFGSKAKETTAGQSTTNVQSNQQDRTTSTQTDRGQQNVDSQTRGSALNRTGLDFGTPGVSDTFQFLLGNQQAGDVNTGRSALTNIASGNSKNNLLDLLGARDKEFQANLPFLVNQARGQAFGSPGGASNAAVAEVVGRSSANQEATAQQLIAAILGQDTQNQLSAGSTLFQNPQSNALSFLQQLGRQSEGTTEQSFSGETTSETQRLLDSLANRDFNSTSSTNFSQDTTGRARDPLNEILGKLLGLPEQAKGIFDLFKGTGAGGGSGGTGGGSGGENEIGTTAGSTLGSIIGGIYGGPAGAAAGGAVGGAAGGATQGVIKKNT